MKKFQRHRILIRLLTIAIAGLVTSPVARSAETWAERLGYPANKRIVILYGSQMGMCFETNQAGQQGLADGSIQSANLMPTCPWFNEFAAWYRQHPNHDVGLCVTMTSGRGHYRWGPVAPRTKVRSLVNSEGYLWRNVLQFSVNATPEDVRREISAQVQKATAAGIRPTHLSPYLGALLARPEFAKAYLDTAKKLWIPAVMVELTPRHVSEFHARGTPVNDQMIQLLTDYPLPKLDELKFMPGADTYEQKREAFFQLIGDLQPGITMIVATPANESEALKSITGEWQQHVWDAAILADPETREFFVKQELIFTNWREMMQRFEGYRPQVEPE